MSHMHYIYIHLTDGLILMISTRALISTVSEAQSDSHKSD